jgi:hypothetical protein
MNTVKDSFKMLNENSRLYNRVVQMNTDKHRFHIRQRLYDQRLNGTRMNTEEVPKMPKVR